MRSADDITSFVIGGGVVGAIRLVEGTSVVGDVVGLAEPENNSSNEFGDRVGGDIGLAEGANVIGDVVGLVESGAGVMGDAVGLVESGADVVGDREVHEWNTTHSMSLHASTQSSSIAYVVSRKGGQ